MSPAARPGVPPGMHGDELSPASVGVSPRAPERSASRSDEQFPAAAGMVQRGPERWRLVAAGVIVAAVVGAIWLWGRPSSSDATVLVAVTTEAWAAGQPPGGFEVVSVPPDIAARLAPPEAVPGSVSAHDVAEGTFVTSALLAEPADVEGAFTSLKFVAETSAWPSPGPQAGSHAVIATAFGGCALDVTTLADGGDGFIVVRLDAAGTGHYAAASELDGLVAWPAPPDGWPLCPQRRSATVVPQDGPLSGFESRGTGWSGTGWSGAGPSGSAQPGSAPEPSPSAAGQAGG